MLWIVTKKGVATELNYDCPPKDCFSRSEKNSKCKFVYLFYFV